MIVQESKFKPKCKNCGYFLNKHGKNYINKKGEKFQIYKCRNCGKTQKGEKIN